mmetsp:Transcript_13815/g.28536  ORF Transcript_13815/g.28536 Transcript_13815/m.28536 type:complete len:222 (+) Transcript_13815:180-845(+)
MACTCCGMWPYCSMEYQACDLPCPWTHRDKSWWWAPCPVGLRKSRMNSLNNFIWKWVTKPRKVNGILFAMGPCRGFMAFVIGPEKNCWSKVRPPCVNNCCPIWVFIRACFAIPVDVRFANRGPPVGDANVLRYWIKNGAVPDRIHLRGCCPPANLVFPPFKPPCIKCDIPYEPLNPWWSNFVKAEAKTPRNMMENIKMGVDCTSPLSWWDKRCWATPPLAT